MKLRYYQKDLIKKIDSNNLIVVNWPTAFGLDYTIEQYMTINDNLKYGYFGYQSVLDINYTTIKPKHITIQTLLGSDIDVLIFEYNNRFKRILIDVIEYCFNHSIKVIIKQNYYDLKETLKDYKYYYSDGNVTKEMYRRMKLKRLIYDNTKDK